MSGLGTLISPWDVATALAAPQLRVGKTLHLRGGTYGGAPYTASIEGSTAGQIMVRSYLAEKPKLNGNLQVSGPYVTFRDLEIFYDGWTGRTSLETGSAPTDIPNVTLRSDAQYTKFINCIIHDFRSPYISKDAQNTELYGCLLYHHGWTAPDRTHGHALYPQNNTGQMIIKDCIMFDCFGWGLHAYASLGSDTYNYLVRGNTSFRAGSLDSDPHPNFLLGAESGQANASQFIANMSYGGSVGLHFYGPGATLEALVDNYMPDGKLGTYTAVTESGNYWGSAIGNQVFVRPNAYQSDRANITIYNQAEAASVNVDISGVTGLNVGDTYNLRNVQDYFVDVVQGIVPANKIISVDMQAVSHTVAAPVGWTAPAKTYPLFGCFVLEKA